MTTHPILGPIDPIDLDALRAALAVIQRETVRAGGVSFSDGRDLIATHAAVSAALAELTTRRARDADVVKLVEKGARLIGAFKSLGQADDIVTDHRTRRECEQAIVAFDAELAYFQRSDKGDAT